MLQLDPAAHYGGTWAALHLDEFLSLITNSHGAPNGCEPQSGIRGDVECSLKRGRILRVPGASLGPASSYNIDLSPHLLYGAGPAISLLLGSGAHHYTEYKLLQGVFMGWHGQEGLRPVPSTRSEVFKDRTLTPLQKRTLMRFLKGCSEALQGQGHLKVRIQVNMSGQM